MHAVLFCWIGVSMGHSWMSQCFSGTLMLYWSSPSLFAFIGPMEHLEERRTIFECWLAHLTHQAHRFANCLNVRMNWRCYIAVRSNDWMQLCSMSEYLFGAFVVVIESTIFISASKFASPCIRVDSLRVSSTRTPMSYLIAGSHSAWPCHELIDGLIDRSSEDGRLIAAFPCARQSLFFES